MKSYVADTYALIEIQKQNTNYAEYTHAQLITTENALLEFGYYLVRAGKNPKELLDIAWDHRRPISKAVGYASIQTKYKLREKKLSYTDCIGYCLALELNIPFLTGDKQFENMPNVEFVR